MNQFVAPPSAGDDLVRRSITAGLMEAHEQHRLCSDPSSAPTFETLADAVVVAMARVGIQMLTPDDVSWGACPSGGPHFVSTSLCAGCLEYDPV